MTNSFRVFLQYYYNTSALYFYLVRVRTGFVCVCAMCFAPTQSVSRWKAGLPSGLISSPQTVDCDSFRRLLIWHIWKPIDVAVNVNFGGFNSPSFSAYCCFSRAALKRLSPFTDLCVRLQQRADRLNSVSLRCTDGAELLPSVIPHTKL